MCSYCILVCGQAHKDWIQYISFCELIETIWFSSVLYILLIYGSMFKHKIHFLGCNFLEVSVCLVPHWVRKPKPSPYPQERLKHWTHEWTQEQMNQSISTQKFKLMTYFHFGSAWEARTIRNCHLNKSILSQFHLLMLLLDRNYNLKPSGSSLSGGNNPVLKGLFIANICSSLVRPLHCKMLWSSIHT